ncbi:hypothetical protein QBC37DRAFT_374116 [Rhypophila decipiens]|uniref:DUF6594 domain-containing protein n=1 Tax=Rhypophila decipiens TaxID=261697 RepID=A0AAN7B747_9PEZI|nr:hypothetical protein QBC37DRAFT_374116 [Rhypophila decipiens]
MEHHAAEEGRQTREQVASETTGRPSDEFEYYDKYNGVQGGWPEFAHRQHYEHNRSIHRHFGDTRERLILDHEVRIHLLKCELDSLDKTDANMYPSIIRGLSYYESSSINTDDAMLERLTKRRELMDELHDILPKYDELLFHQERLRSLPRISRPEHEDYVEQVERHNLLDKPARGFLYYPDDFVTTRVERAHGSFEWLLYGDSWLYSFLRKWFLSKKRDDGAEYISKDRLRTISISVIVCLTLGLLFTPMLILLLAPINKWQSALVVGFFGVVSATGMSSLPRIKTVEVFIAMSAYMAVLVTFLANLSGQCQCG